MIVAIDGPSGAGKTTVSRAVARRLGFLLLDTGALYRGAALLALRASVDFEDGSAVARLVNDAEFAFDLVDGAQHLVIDGEDVAQAIRTPQISDGASRVSAQAPVRQALLELQRELGRRRDSVVEGRDIGTVVFPDAELKFFLTASVHARVERRRREYEQRGDEVSDEAMRREVIERDRRDQSRDVAPLKAAPDAVQVDSTALTLEEVVDLIVDQVRS